MLEHIHLFTRLWRLLSDHGQLLRVLFQRGPSCHLLLQRGPSCRLRRPLASFRAHPLPLFDSPARFPKLLEAGLSLKAGLFLKLDESAPPLLKLGAAASVEGHLLLGNGGHAVTGLPAPIYHLVHELELVRGVGAAEPRHAAPRQLVRLFAAFAQEARDRVRATQLAAAAHETAEAEGARDPPPAPLDLELARRQQLRHLGTLFGLNQ